MRCDHGKVAVWYGDDEAIIYDAYTGERHALAELHNTDGSPVSVEILDKMSLV